MEYNPENTAAVVVDIQNDFCDPSGELYAEGSEEAIEGVNDVIEFANRNDLSLWYTKDTHQEGDPEFEQWGEHCLQGSWGSNIHDDVTLEKRGQTVEKSTYDAFFQTSFNDRLQREGIDTLIICGTLANVCVQETASSAALHGYHVVIVEDAVGYITKEQRNAALNHIEFLIGETTTVESLNNDSPE